jgi:hypothetical protein
MSYPQGGTTWYDISGNSINGSLNNGPTFNSTNNSLAFDGTDDNVSTSYNSAVAFLNTSPYTLEVLVNAQSQINYPGFMNRESNVGLGRDGYNLIYTLVGQSAGQVFVSSERFTTGTSTFAGFTTATSSFFNNWHHVLSTYDGSMVRIYYDGVLQGSGSSTGNITNASKALEIANRNGAVLKGNLSYARVYNRALSQSEILQNYYQGNIVTSSLAVALDAGNLLSYPGSGTTWYDLSGNGKNFTLVNGVTWNSAGYFTLDGIDDYISGPAGNTFGLGQEHTIEIVINNTLASTTTLFNWRSSQTDRAIMSHAPYSDGVVYYDVGGCCGVTNRISYTPSPSLTNRLTYMIFRCRTSQTPYRQVFENTVEKVNSGTNATANISLSSNIALIGAYNEANLAGSGGVWKGNLYSFRMYTRALTDAEVQQNYNAMKNRYNL